MCVVSELLIDTFHVRILTPPSEQPITLKNDACLLRSRSNHVSVEMYRVCATLSLPSPHPSLTWFWVLHLWTVACDALFDDAQHEV
jgi:hypothetical protein